MVCLRHIQSILVMHEGMSELELHFFNMYLAGMVTNFQRYKECTPNNCYYHMYYYNVVLVPRHLIDAIIPTLTKVRMKIQ